MRTLIYSVEERELGRDEEPLFVPHTMPPVCLPTSPNQSVLQHMMALMFSITTVNAQIGP